MSPTSGSVEAVASWIREAFIEDFGQDAASRVSLIVKENDVSLRVFRSLTSQDILELFPSLSFGQKRTLKLLIEQANKILESAQPANPQITEKTSTPITPVFPQASPPETSPAKSQPSHFDHPTTPPTVRRSPILFPPCRPSTSSPINPSNNNSPTSNLPTSNLPTSNSPTSNSPTSNSPTSNSPTSNSPTSNSPIRSQPISTPPVRTTSASNPLAGNPLDSNPPVSNPSASNSFSVRISSIKTSPRCITPRSLRDDPITPPYKRRKTLLNTLSPSTPRRSPQLNRPRHYEDFLVCIVGPSGVGKSSTLNAILDGYEVLPTSSMRASTAVPIEIRYKQSTVQIDHQDSDTEQLPFEAMHEDDISDFLTTQVSEDKRFIAEIDFISEQHWRNLVDTALSLLQRKQTHRQKLRDILTSATQDMDDDARKAVMEDHCRSEVDENPAEAAALAAVRAVLGESNFSTMQQVINLCEQPKIAAVLKHLGQSLRFSFDKPRDVSRRIERFLATSTNRRSAAVWPLVKSSRIYGPWKMLSRGMVLVDLPGLQDANSARNQVVSNYIHRCHAIISAAKISRARDNKTAHDLLTGPIRTGIESGRVTFVGFIATHSDDIKPEEIVNDLHASFSRNYREGLRQADAFGYENGIPSIEDIKRQVSRLCLLRRTSDGLAELGDAPNEDCFTNRQYEIEELSKKLRSNCIVARNGFVTQALEDQFKQEMDSIANIPTFKVFCVSSTQYTSIMREGCADVSRDFADVRFTGIPALSDSLWSLSKTAQLTREEGRRVTKTAFRPTRSDEVMDEPAVENGEELRGFLRSILEEYEGDKDADAEAIRANMEKMAQEASAAREAELSDAEKRVQSRCSYLKEIIALNERAAVVLLDVLKRCKSSSVSVASDRRVDMWLDQASEHTKETKAKGAMLAILGDSGSGKSSLLNALLDVNGEDVLPVSGVRACTAAPIAISYCGTGGFHAEIEFLGIEEWHDELFQLVSDLEEVTKQPLKNRRMPYFERPRSEIGRIAYDKIMSVYGRIASYKALTEGNCSVESRLGTTAKVHDFSAKGIRRKLEAFCSSRSDDTSRPTGRWGEAGRLWPLVRVAHLKGPFKLLSDSGGCLLDLPGLQDANAARNTVVQSYLGSCSGFIIAAPIKRAVDNQTARELLGRQFRRQLLLDGRISSVAFAATQADDIDALQVASELGLRGVSSYSGVPEQEVKAKFAKHAVKIAKMRARIKSLAKRKSDLNSRLKKEKVALDRARAQALSSNSDYDEDDCYGDYQSIPQRHQDRVDHLESQLSEVQTTISGLNSELGKRERVLNNVCSLARNEYCRTQVREDFVEGIQEITDGAFAADLGGRAEAPPQLPVFTTSSHDFRHLNQKRTEQAKAFYTVDETGVPRLFQFVRHNMLVSRINAEYGRTERLAVLLSSFSQYLLMEDRATATQRESLSLEVENILKGIDENVGKISTQAMNKLNRVLLEGPMKKTLALGGIKARENATANLVRVEESVHWATYRACLRRFGVYVSPTAGAMNVNESLMAPLMETVIPNWREAFGTGVSKILQSFVANAVKLADSTLAAVAKQVALSGLSAAPLEGAGELRLTAKKSFDMAVSEARKCMEKEFEDLQRNCWQELPLSVVQTSLKRGYLRANDESGPGCVARLKAHMRSEVRHRRSVMFDKCVNQINTAVKKVLTQVSTMTSSKFKSYFVGLLDNIEVLWDSKCDLSHEKCVCLASALKNLTRLIDKIGIGSLALKKSIDGVDFDSADSARSVLPVLDGTVELASLPLIDGNVLDNIIPKRDEISYWANVKRENQLCTPNMLGNLYGRRSQGLLAGESSSDGAPSRYDSEDDDWGTNF